MMTLNPEERERKVRLCRTLADGEEYSSIVVRRNQTKSGHTRYYIYDNDNEKLQIAAECHYHSDYVYYISLESKLFDKTSALTFAKLINRRYDHYYQSFRLEESNELPCITIRYLSHIEKKNSTKRQMEIKYSQRNEGMTTVVQSLDFAADFRNKFPNISDKIQDSEKNFFLKTQNGNHCFSFAKAFDDEYYFSVSYPFSILEGFFIALSTFHKLKDE